MRIALFDWKCWLCRGIWFTGAKKARGPKAPKLPDPFDNGTILRDVIKKEWKLGPQIGQGGFGLIYLGKHLSIYLFVVTHLYYKTNCLSSKINIESKGVVGVCLPFVDKIFQSALALPHCQEKITPSYSFHYIPYLSYHKLSPNRCGQFAVFLSFSASEDLHSPAGPQSQYVVKIVSFG